MNYKKDDVFTILENSFYELSEDYNVSSPYDVVKDDKNIFYSNKQVNSLLKIYFQISPADKDKMLRDLVEFSNIKYGYKYASIGYSFLIHSGHAEIAFKKMAKDFTSYQNQVDYAQVLLSISNIMKYEWKIVPKDQIEYLYKWINDIYGGKNVLGKNRLSYPNLYRDAFKEIENLRRKLNIIKMIDLEERILVGVNDEINTDQKALKYEFKKYNFPDDLTEALDKIDSKISTSTDNFDFKGIMDLTRSFTERLFQHIAITLDASEGKKVNEKDSEEIAKFFIQKQLISANQADLLVSLRHFLSNEGAHRLKSRPDDARLSRNMVVEISLYLILRLNDLTERQ